MRELFNKYNTFLKEKFGGRIQKISIDAGFTCPNRDGTKGIGGCTFCNNASFSPATKNRELDVYEQIEKGIMHFKGKHNIKGYLAYFQSYSNTYSDLSELKRLYEKALSHPDVIGLCIGTRGDCIDTDKIKYLADLNKSHEIVIEYGVESIFNSTLIRINRCHDFRSVYDSIMLTNEHSIDTCVHVMLGFPWENSVQWRFMAQVISALPIKYIKIHQLLIVKGSIMYKEYKQKKIKLLDEEEYLAALADFINYLRPDIVIQRTFAFSDPDILVAPLWCFSLRNFQKKIEQYLDAGEHYQGKLYSQVDAAKCLALHLGNN